MTILRYLLDVLIPTITAYLANSDALYAFLKNASILSDEVNIIAVKEFFLIINIIFTVFVLTPQIIYAEKKRRTADQKNRWLE